MNENTCAACDYPLDGNAIKVTPAGGKIRIETTKRADEIAITVSDTGPGILVDELPHVFERFWQARGNGRAGIGLGLSIAKALVEAQGGRIWAGAAEGGGAAFHFTLPLATPAAARSGERPMWTVAPT